MPKLTKKFIDDTEKKPKDQFFWDDEVRGFGLKLTKAGRKTFVFQYRMGGHGTPTRKTIGSYGSLTPIQARSIAADLKHRIAQGIDPRSDRTNQDAALTKEGEAQYTIGKLIDEFSLHHLKNLRSGPDVRKLLDREIRSRWGETEIVKIVRRDVGAALDEVETEKGPFARNHCAAAVRSMFNWALARDLMPSNPAAKAPMASAKSRERVLSDPEIGEIWVASCSLVSIFAPFTQMLLMTAQRRNEVAGMEWEEINFDGARWSIPGQRTKNGLSNDVPLTAEMLKLLETIPRLGKYVFTSDGLTHISGFSNFKANLDSAIGVRRAKIGSAHGQSGNELAPWTFHDFRRTAATNLAKLGVRREITERLLNHQSGVISGVAKIYNRYDYWDERKEALQAWSKRLNEIVGVTASETGAKNDGS